MNATVRSRYSNDATAAAMESMPVAERLCLIAELAPDAVFTTSLGLEDQVLTALISRHAPSIRVVTLDTGRLFDETLALIGQTRSALGIEIDVLIPDAADVTDYVAQYGENGFYDSVEARHACCHVRKVKLLDRALSGRSAWVTGLRRGQSGNRASVPVMQRDEVRKLWKFNPLADWSREDLEAYASDNNVPLNPLHGRGYPSIGCAPCTRAVKPGENERAGRWWWENDNKRECGLHVA